MGKWRPPKKNNKKAWKRIENGEILWDRKAVERAAKKEAQRNYEIQQRSKAMVRQQQEEIGAALGIPWYKVSDRVRLEYLRQKGYQRFNRED